MFTLRVNNSRPLHAPVAFLNKPKFNVCLCVYTHTHTHNCVFILWYWVTGQEADVIHLQLLCTASGLEIQVRLAFLHLPAICELWHAKSSSAHMHSVCFLIYFAWGWPDRVPQWGTPVMLQEEAVWFLTTFPPSLAEYYRDVCLCRWWQMTNASVGFTARF